MSIFGQQKRVARAIDLQGVFRSGSLGLRGPYQAVNGLGSSAAPGEIPWQCWGIQAFKDCHVANWAAAQKDCASGTAAKYGMTIDDCTNSFSAGDDGSKCVPKYCGQYAAITAPATATLPAATVKKAQAQLNADLTRAGFKTIGVDGQLGPATCGAASYLYNSSPRQSTVWTDYNLYAYCGTTPGTNPTLVGASKPLTTYVAPTTTIVQGQQPVTAITHEWEVVDAQMAELQTSINRILSNNGMNPIAITQKLDAQTCGAMKWIKDNTGSDLLTMNGQNCQAYVMPTKKAASVTASNLPPGSGPPPGAPLPPAPGVTKAGMMMGGLALLVVGGGYYYAKKKGMI
jgi:hypothetical protein